MSSMDRVIEYYSANCWQYKDQNPLIFANPGIPNDLAL